MTYVLKLFVTFLALLTKAYQSLIINSTNKVVSCHPSHSSHPSHASHSSYPSHGGDTNFVLVQAPSCLVCGLLLIHYDKILNMYYI